MIEVSGSNHETLALALDTERMLGQVRLARLLPLVAVAALRAGLTSPLLPLGLGTLADVRMVITVARIAGKHIAALRVAWLFWPQRHSRIYSESLSRATERFVGLVCGLSCSCCGLCSLVGGGASLAG